MTAYQNLKRRIWLVACGLYWFSVKMSNSLRECRDNFSIVYNLSKNGADSLMSSTLVACFSKSGRTKAIAEFIASELASPLHEIITQKKYPRTYFMTILESRSEFKKGERPALISEPVANFASYDRIVLGFPVWFFTCPMAIVSWLESYDFTGKEIYPFCTSGGSSCAKATAKIRELCPSATVHDGRKFGNIDKSILSEWLK